MPSSIVAGNFSMKLSTTAWPVSIELPKSPWSSAFT